MVPLTANHVSVFRFNATCDRLTAASAGGNIQSVVDECSLTKLGVKCATKMEKQNKTVLKKYTMGIS